MLVRSVRVLRTAELTLPFHPALLLGRSAHSIDTPGVIDRVSSLFRNYPVLISDFNLFLPDGYRLDCHFDRGNPDRVTSIDVITPAGIQLLPPGRSSNLTGIRLPGMVEPTPITRHYRPASQKPVSKPAPPPPKPTAAVKPPAAAPAKPNPKRVIQTSSNMLGGRRPDPPGAQDSASASRPAEEDDRTAGPARPAGAVAQSQPQAPSQTTTPGGASRTATPTSAGGIAADKRPPIEFNHAISYVNKIKNRFISQPEIYKSFLDILQTYQKEQRPIQDVSLAKLSVRSHGADSTNVPRSTRKSRSCSRGHQTS